MLRRGELLRDGLHDFLGDKATEEGAEWVENAPRSKCKLVEEIEFIAILLPFFRLLVIPLGDGFGELYELSGICKVPSLWCFASFGLELVERFEGDVSKLVVGHLLEVGVR